MVKVAFIQDELRTRDGIMILSAVLKKAGHKTSVFSKEGEKDLIKSVLEYDPYIIALSSSTYEHKIMIKIANQIKAADKSKFIIMGGPHPTFFPEVIYEKSIDAICIGEGEEAMVEVANKIKSDISRIKNIWIKNKGKIIKNPIRDLIDIDKIPFSDREIYYKRYPSLKSEETKIFMVARGCPYSCSYCFNHVLKKMYQGKGIFMRYRNPRLVIREIKDVKKKYGLKWIQFNDDTFNINKEWVNNFLKMYRKEINIPFIVNIRVDNVTEDEIKMFKEAGVDRINFGVEHGNEQFRKKYLNRQMSNAQIIKVGRLCNKYSIRLFTANMVGFPNETIQLALETIKLNRQFKTEWASCSVLQPYPKTEICDFCKQAGFLKKDYNINDLNAPNTWNADIKVTDSVLKQKNMKALVNLHCFFNVLVNHYWLLPIIYPLLYFKPNQLYEMIWQWPYFKRKLSYANSKTEKKMLYKKYLGWKT